MVLGGLQKTTLIDFPGKVAATVFTVGCNFRCPFCHNPELVLPNWSGKRGVISESEFFNFLKRRRGKLDGVCITGGEPTIQADLEEFIQKIKRENFLVKLDTNGTRPDVLRHLLAKQQIDYVAMDIKNSLRYYEKACGVTVDLTRIKLSVDLIKQSAVAYEFRTTVVPGIHQEGDFQEIGRWLKGAKRYVLQAYYNEGKVLNMEKMKQLESANKISPEIIKPQVEKYFQEVLIR